MFLMLLKFHLYHHSVIIYIVLYNKNILYNNIYNYLVYMYVFISNFMMFHYSEYLHIDNC